MIWNKKIKTAAVFLFFLFYVFPVSASQGLQEIKLISDGGDAGTFTVMIREGMGYVKTADVANIFSLEVQWLPDKKSIRIINRQNDDVRLFMESKKVYVKNRLCTLKKEPLLADGKSWIPLELVLTKSFQGFAGARVLWDFGAKTLSISTEGKMPAKIPEPEEREKKPSSGERQSFIKEMKPHKKTKRNVRTIVIDPGHGGKDPGACSLAGVKEKDITLDIALKLYHLLKNDPAFNAILTRNSDIFLPLATRALIADRAKADLFISIHINASYRSNSRGFEVYFLSDTASDDEAQNVANTENAVVEMEEATTYKTGVNSILWSMKLNEYMNESAECCAFIGKNIGDMFEYKRGSDSGIKQAGFYVLKGARMPAVLVEAGFITNKKDLRILKKNSKRQLIAQKLYEAIGQYKKWSEK